LFQALFHPSRDRSAHGKQNQFYSPCSRPGRTGASDRVANENAARDTDRANTHIPCGGMPMLALDMYEHAYHIDFGANAKA
jgi:superoxide dismutase